MADGATAARPGPWPTLEYDLVTVVGLNNNVGMPIFLPKLDAVNRLCVSETTGGTLTLPDVPGFSLTVKPGSATFPAAYVGDEPLDGDDLTLWYVAHVHFDQSFPYTAGPWVKVEGLG